MKHENIVYKAVAKAFKDSVNGDKLTIARVHTVEKKDYFDDANSLRVGQFPESATNEHPSHQLVTLHKIDDSV